MNNKILNLNINLSDDKTINTNLVVIKNDINAYKFTINLKTRNSLKELIPYDLTGATTISILFKDAYNNPPVKRYCTIIGDRKNGIVEYVYQGNEITTLGKITTEFKVLHTNEDLQDFRISFNGFSFKIAEDIDNDPSVLQNFIGDPDIQYDYILESLNNVMITERNFDINYEFVDADQAGTAESKVGAHNTNIEAHSDIRTEVAKKAYSKDVYLKEDVYNKTETYTQDEVDNVLKEAVRILNNLTTSLNKIVSDNTIASTNTLNSVITEVNDVKNQTDQVKQATQSVQNATEAIRSATEAVRSATESVRVATEEERIATELVRQAAIVAIADAEILEQNRVSIVNLAADVQNNKTAVDSKAATVETDRKTVDEKTTTVISRADEVVFNTGYIEDRADEVVENTATVASNMATVIADTITVIQKASEVVANKELVDASLLVVQGHRIDVDQKATEVAADKVVVVAKAIEVLDNTAIATDKALTAFNSAGKTDDNLATIITIKNQTNDIKTDVLNTETRINAVEQNVINLMAADAKSYFFSTIAQRDNATGIKDCDRCSVYETKSDYIYDTKNMDNDGIQSEWFLTSSWDALKSVAWDIISGKPTFATVATSGSYTDLLNKPTRFDTMITITDGIWNYTISDKISLTTTNLVRIDNLVIAGSVGQIYTTFDLTLPAQSKKSIDYDYVIGSNYIYTFSWDGTYYYWSRTVVI